MTNILRLTLTATMLLGIRIYASAIPGSIYFVYQSPDVLSCKRCLQHDQSNMQEFIDQICENAQDCNKNANEIFVGEFSTTVYAYCDNDSGSEQCKFMVVKASDLIRSINYYSVVLDKDINAAADNGEITYLEIFNPKIHGAIITSFESTYKHSVVPMPIKVKARIKYQRNGRLRNIVNYIVNTYTHLEITNTPEITKKVYCEDIVTKTGNLISHRMIVTQCRGISEPELKPETYNDPVYFIRFFFSYITAEGKNSLYTDYGICSTNRIFSNQYIKLYQKLCNTKRMPIVRRP